jgi:ATP-dependent Clp protease ATP-binding subunit ClpC
MYKNKFTKNAIAVVESASKACVRLGSKVMTVEHLFIGILSVKEGVGSRILARLGLDPEATLESIENELRVSSSQDVNSNLNEVADILVSDDVKKAFEKAFDYAMNAGHTYIGTEHLLLGILSISDNAFVKELDKLNINFRKIKSEIDSFVQYPEFTNTEVLDSLTGQPNVQLPDLPNKNSSQNRGFLENYGRNLVREARQGKLDPVIGRDKEILRVMQILARRTKNNPILLGDAGVGKTAVVEGLAQRIANNAVSPVLAGFEIWSVDTASIIAGSQLRGDVESKLLDLISEIESRQNVILFIDEIHTILGAGSTSNSPLDIANILKPALARGALRCIGATTVDEYKKHFDEDPALQRRFQPVDIEELSEEDTLTVLKNLRPIYEAFHNVKITDGALQAAIKLSKRYITDRYLPDKAIDIIDEACARNKLERVQLSDEFKQELERLRQIIKDKNDALKTKDFDKAASLLEEENQITQRLNEIEKQLKRSWNSSNRFINERDIKNVITLWTKIPLETLDQSTVESIKKLKADLSRNILGQEYATSVVVNAIKRTKAGLAGFDRPLASFLFVGPTGVGKTELAKQLAKSLFGSKDALIQVDMSELMESHSVSKLIGSPPGYVGFEQGGLLTDRVRRRPFSVLLFDEIEKASPEVLNILLQILDEGRLTDSKGRTVNFKNTIVIMTSNIGAEYVHKDIAMGLRIGEKKRDDELDHEFDHAMADIREKIITELKDYLQPEFLNRIDDIVVFRELTQKDVQKIARLQIRNLVNRLRKENRVIVHNADSKDIIDYVTKVGFSEEYGAREIRRVIKNTIENLVADKLIDLQWNNDKKGWLHLEVCLGNNKISIKEIKSISKNNSQKGVKEESESSMVNEASEKVDESAIMT